MSRRDDRRRELEAQRAAEEAAQYERERRCLHWNCRITRCDWNGRPQEITCDDCGGINQDLEEET